MCAYLAAGKLTLYLLLLVFNTKMMNYWSPHCSYSCLYIGNNASENWYLQEYLTWSAVKRSETEGIWSQVSLITWLAIGQWSVDDFSASPLNNPPFLEGALTIQSCSVCCLLVSRKRMRNSCTKWSFDATENFPQKYASLLKLPTFLFYAKVTFRLFVSFIYSLALITKKRFFPVFKNLKSPLRYLTSERLSEFN